MSRYTPVFAAISHSARLADLPDDECRLFYMLLLPQCDQWGRCNGNARKLNAIVWPLLQKTTETTDRCLVACIAVGLVALYERGGERWIQVPDWEDKAGTIGKKDHRRKSDYPAPDEAYRLGVAVKADETALRAKPGQAGPTPGQPGPSLARASLLVSSPLLSADLPALTLIPPCPTDTSPPAGETLAPPAVTPDPKPPKPRRPRAVPADVAALLADPANADLAPCADAIREWAEHKRSKFTEVVARNVFAQARDWGPARFRAAVRHSAASAQIGLFEPPAPRLSFGQRGPAPGAPTDDAIAYARKQAASNSPSLQAEGREKLQRWGLLAPTPVNGTAVHA